MIPRALKTTRMGRPGPSREVTTDDVLAVFDALDDSCKPLTARDIASELDCSPPTANKRLSELVTDGDLQTREVGSGSRVWWRADSE
jgi:predicted ArsR family transcriptional regulator